MVREKIQKLENVPVNRRTAEGSVARRTRWVIVDSGTRLVIGDRRTREGSRGRTGDRRTTEGSRGRTGDYIRRRLDHTDKLL